jgi:hypothetical protein
MVLFVFLTTVKLDERIIFEKIRNDFL